MKPFARILIAAAVCSPCMVDAATAQLTEAKCSALTNLRIPAAQIGLPTTGAVVTAAQMVDATDAVASHCLVSGNIKPVDPKPPNIELQVALPATWNTKAMMLGGGGFNGTIPPVTGGSYNAGRSAYTPSGRSTKARAT